MRPRPLALSVVLPRKFPCQGPLLSLTSLLEIGRPPTQSMTCCSRTKEHVSSCTKGPIETPSETLSQMSKGCEELLSGLVLTMVVLLKRVGKRLGSPEA